MCVYVRPINEDSETHANDAHMHISVTPTKTPINYRDLPIFSGKAEYDVVNIFC